MSKRIYIAGPMTGYEQYNFPAFDAAVVYLTAQGHEPVSPADITRRIWREKHGEDFDPTGDHDGADYSMFLLADFAELATCEAIYLLPGWDKSKGVAAELAFAKCLGIPVINEPSVTPLNEAKRLVHGDRGEDYGHPYDDFSRTARMWSALLGTKLVAGCHVSAAEVGLCMIALKLSREVNRPKLDNLTDIAGYAETVAMVHSESKRRGA